MNSVGESAAKWLKLDALCDQFEADCARGTIPAVETYVESIPVAERTDAVRELLKIELHYRKSSGVSIDASEMKTRFPGLDSKWLQDQLNPTIRSTAITRELVNSQNSLDRIQDAPEWPQLPGFEILGVLGRGGMGIVYKARQVRLGRFVALKMIRAGELASPETITRFRAESRTLAQLQHPNLVQVFEVGEDQKRMFLAFEFVEGGSLDKRLNGVPQLPKPSAKLVRSLAHATQYAHTRSIIHRDLKPANVLLEVPTRLDSTQTLDENATPRFFKKKAEPVGSSWEKETSLKISQTTTTPTSSGAIVDFGEPKITDFGLAKHLEEDSSQTRTGMIIGSPSYMSPEQAAGSPDQVGIATDVYSLGAILYEMLTGRPPFRAPTVSETLRQLQEMEPVSPRLIQPTVPRDLETICLKCLAKEPDRRYESAGALADDLDRFLRNEPVLARPVTFAERTWRWCVRHPLVSVLTAILFLVTFGGTAVLAWKWNDADHHRLLAEKNAEQYRIERDTAKTLREIAEENQRLAEEKEEETRQTLYLRRIGQAYGEWQSNLVGRAAERLEQCPEELRGWEWYHLKTLCRSEYLILRGHDSELSCVEYSNDGRTIVSCSGVLGGKRDGEAIIWDAVSGEQRHTLRGHTGSIHDVAMSADGSRIVTASAGNVKIWNDQGKELLTLPDPVRGAFAVAMTPDGKLIATGGFRPTIHLWNGETGKLIRAFEGHTNNVFGLAFSPDGKTLCSSGYDSSVRIWNVETGEQRHPPLFGPNSIYYLTLSPDGRYLAYSEHNTLFITDLRADTLHPIPYQCACDTINCLNFSPEGRRLAVSSLDGNVLLIDVKTGRELRRLHTHDGTAKGVSIGDGGRKIATAGLDGLVKVWNAFTDGPADQIDLNNFANRGLFRRMAITPDGTRMLLPSSLNMAAYRSGANEALISDPDKRGVHNSRSLILLEGHTSWLTDVAVSADGQWYASSSADETARIWNAQTNQIDKILKGHTGEVTSVEFSHDGRWLATAGEDGTVRIWDRATGEQIHQLQGHTGRVNNVAFHSRDPVLASAGEDGKLCLWNVGSATEPRVLSGHRGAVTSVTFNHNGTLLASSGRDRTVRVWNHSEGQPLHVLHGHAADVLDVAFSLDDRRLASASADHTVKLWDPMIGDEAFTLRAQRPILSVAFHPDGKRLLATQYWSVRFFSTDRMNTEAEEELGLKAANMSWHIDQTNEAIKANDLISARFHIKHLEKLDGHIPALFILRGNLAAQVGDWPTARQEFAEAETRVAAHVEAITGTGLSALRLGDIESYRKACQRLFEQIPKTTPAWHLNEIAWHGCLAPDSGISPQLLIDTSQRALKSAANPNDKALYLNTLAAAQFRAGSFEESRRTLEESMKMNGCVEDWILVAMVEHKLGHSDEAHEWLKRSQRWVASMPPREKTRLNWQIHECRSLLLQEAESMLGSRSQQPDPSER
jgi:WD40 repeat protein/serine/threonine protein kinase